MGAEIFEFPLARAPEPPRTAAGAQAFRPRRRYRFADMVRLIGLEEFEPRTQVDHLRALAEQRGLPLPRNPRLYQGRVQTGPAAIGQRSSWCALEVDAWIDGQHTPPPAVAAGLPPLPPRVRDDCAARARQLARA